MQLFLLALLAGLVLSLIFGVAIANLSHILTEIDLFERPRNWLGKIWLVGKVFTCKFCMADKMSLACSFLVVYLTGLHWWLFPAFWQLIHYISRAGHKLEDGIPVSAAANVSVNDQEPEP